MKSINRKEKDVDITHTRYKRPIDNLIYCMLLQAAKDIDQFDNEITKSEKETARTFFESGDAKCFYDYLKGEPNNNSQKIPWLLEGFDV